MSAELDFASDESNTFFRVSEGVHAPHSVLSAAAGIWPTTNSRQGATPDYHRKTSLISEFREKPAKHG